MPRSSAMITAGLIGTFVLFLLPQRALAACPPPAEYPNQVSVQDGDVLVSFASDQHAYLEGQQIRFFLSFENTGTEPVHFPCPYSPEYRITVMPDSCLSYGQAGCDTVSSLLPGFVYWFSPGIYLDPGQCYTTTATLTESRPTFPLPSGVYHALGGLPDYTEEFSVPTGGAELFLTIGATSGVPDPEPGTHPATWGRIKAFYE